MGGWLVGRVGGWLVGGVCYLAGASRHGKLGCSCFRHSPVRPRSCKPRGPRLWSRGDVQVARDNLR